MSSSSDAKPRRINSVAVYCASSLGVRPSYANSAISLGKALARSNRTLVYGGGTMGTMGVVSSTVAAEGGTVIGVRPAAMMGGEKSQVDSGKQPIPAAEASTNSKVTTIVVNSMHQRKIEMARRADGFVGLPGGFGTFEEIFEVITWTQLNIHTKPVVLLNVENFYSPLRSMIDTAVDEGFIQPLSKNLLKIVDGPEDQTRHADYDWGQAALDALEGWEIQDGWRKVTYVWVDPSEGKEEGDALDRT